MLLLTAIAALVFQSGAGTTTIAGGLKEPAAPAPLNVPTKTLAPEQLADLMMARKRYREALEQYQLCDQNSAVIANKMGIAYHQMLILSGAMQQYRRATQLDPHYSEAFNNLGTIYYSQKSYRRATHLYKTALRMAPESAAVFSNLGSAYFSMHHFKDAMTAYQKALDLDPEIFTHNSVNGILLQDRSVADKARFDYYMAKIYARKGLNEQALQFIRKSLEEGFTEPHRFRDDTEFAALKGTAAFEELMQNGPRKL